MNPVKSAWRIVAIREILTKLKDKAFIFSTLFTLVIIGVSIGLNAFLGTRSSESTIAVVDQAGVSMVEAAQKTNEAADSKDLLEAQQFDSAEAALDAVHNEDVDAALIHQAEGWQLSFKSSQDTDISTPLTQAVSTTVTAENAASQGVDLQALYQGSELQTQVLSGDDHSFAAMMIGLVFAMVFYMAVLLFGQMIAMSVVEEKQNRIVEIIATAIPTSQLLAGKIVGNTVLAVTQIALYAVVALIGFNATGATEEYGWVLGSAGWFVIFYIAGFVAIATIWAAVGAMASRTEDIGSISTPITMISVAILFGGIYAKGTALTVLSFVPIASSIAMPMRLLTEDVAVWEPIVALVLTVIATYFLTKLGARIYRNNIMRGGSAVTWKQALKKQKTA